MFGRRKRDKTESEAELRAEPVKPAKRKSKRKASRKEQQRRRALQQKKEAQRKEEAKRNKRRLSAQQTIPYREMSKDGICRVHDKLYSKTIRFFDINYQLAQVEDKDAIFEGWCEFLN